jgi:hypothetical protein
VDFIEIPGVPLIAVKAIGAVSELVESDASESRNGCR